MSQAGTESGPITKGKGAHFQFPFADEKPEFILTKVRWQGSPSVNSNISTEKAVPIALNESVLHELVYFLAWCLSQLEVVCMFIYLM